METEKNTSDKWNINCETRKQKEARYIPGTLDQCGWNMINEEGGGIA